MHKRRETGEYFYAVEVVCVYLGSGFYTCPEEDSVMTTQLSSRSSCAAQAHQGQLPTWERAQAVKAQASNVQGDEDEPTSLPQSSTLRSLL